MPNWYWEKKDLRATPSQEKGLDFGTEARYRREGVRYPIQNSSFSTYLRKGTTTLLIKALCIMGFYFLCDTEHNNTAINYATCHI